MKVNPGKCHILLCTKNPIDVWFEKAFLTSSAIDAVHGITNDSDPVFDKHVQISDLGDKSSKILNESCWFAYYMSLKT